MEREELPVLLARVSAGSDTAFRQLFDIFRPNIYTTALRITNNEWMAEDVVQDTFVKVWISRTDLLSLQNFEAWLYVIARNITLNILKKRTQYRTYFLEEARDAILNFYPSADYEVQDKEFNSILRDAVERLPPKQQLAYRLIKEQNLKREEAALELGVSPETVKWNLEQAMKSVRAYCVARIKDVPMIIILYFFSKYF